MKINYIQDKKRALARKADGISSKFKENSKPALLFFLILQFGRFYQKVQVRDPSS